jgi:undecaprenyl-diphosphatase
MNVLESIVLGLVQGLTEFLPVSSSGHLVLLQNIFGISEAPLFFDTMVHVGTLVAVFIVLWKSIWALFKKPFHKLGYLIIATIPAIIFTLLFKDFIESTFTGKFLGYEFLVTALILIVAELLSDRIRQRRHIKAGSAAVMGVMQAVSIFPAISRSGATIAGGLACGIERREAATFSFLMSIPAILGSVVLQGYDIVKQNTVTVDWVTTLIGMACAAVSGYFAIRFMIALVSKKKLYGFAIYVAIVGIFVLLDQNVFGLINWA